MKIELDLDECHELFSTIVDRLITEAGLPDQDRAALKRWRSQSMRPGSGPMKELAAKINADLARTLQNKTRSAIVRPDWR